MLLYPWIGNWLYDHAVRSQAAGYEKALIEKSETELQNSILAAVAGLIAPVFAPLGFGDWRICTSLIAGFMAKESVVSTLSVLFGSTKTLLEVLSPLSAASLLVFCLLYTPCIAAISSIKRELGAKWAVGIVLFQCAVAWVVAFVVHLIGMAILAL